MPAVIRLTTVLVLVVSLGLHWALLQTIAWTGMVLTYSQENSLRDAVRMTFDGEHPCRMCQVVKQGRADDRQTDKQSTRPGTKFELAIVWQTAESILTLPYESIAAPATHAEVRRDAPPTPPPRRPRAARFA